MKFFHLLALLGAVYIFSCSEDSEPGFIPDPEEDSLIITEAFPSLDFNRPVDLQSNGDNQLYVVEQRGVIQVFENDPATTTKNVFLDIQSRVDASANEEGLLGLAFHPDFTQNGYFFVNYTTQQETTRISRFSTTTPGGSEVDPDSELILMEFPQPFTNHNGGQLAFGMDGYLYISVGDGGSGGDPQGHGQNTATLLGSILRIDVDVQDEGLNYGIPDSNPLVGNQSGSREEIFAYGLRNPWRMSFDHETGDLWTADVGQNEFEEIDIIESGGNYGWKITEASSCFQSNDCDKTGLIDPYFEYDHNNGDGSITGGYVYRGTSIPSLVGWYVYADFLTGRVWILETGATDPRNILVQDTNHRISTFGVDSQQELYFCSLDGGIFKIDID